MYGISYFLLEWTEGVNELKQKQKHFHSRNMDKLNAEISAMHKHNLNSCNFYENVKVTTFYKNRESPWTQKIDVHPAVLDKTCWVA